MDIPSIPQGLDDWNMDMIESLLNIPTIESEKLECKRKIRVYRRIKVRDHSSGKPGIGYLI